MIKQKVKLAKLISDDGNFNFSSAKVGMEVWVEPRTVKLGHYVRKGTRLEFDQLIVKIAEVDQWVPVSMLEWTNEFEISGHG